MIRRVFTFGQEHSCGCGRSLAGCYTVIQAADPRTEMIRVWGTRWAFEYENELQAGVGKYGLRCIHPIEAPSWGICNMCGAQDGY